MQMLEKRLIAKTQRFIEIIRKYKGKQIHEIKPVKFNGSPVDHEIKIVLTRIEHAKLTTFWKRLQLQIEKDT